MLDKLFERKHFNTAMITYVVLIQWAILVTAVYRKDYVLSLFTLSVMAIMVWLVWKNYRASKK